MRQRHPGDLAAGAGARLDGGIADAVVDAVASAGRLRGAGVVELRALRNGGALVAGAALRGGAWPIIVQAGVLALRQKRALRAEARLGGRADAVRCAGGEPALH